MLELTLPVAILAFKRVLLSHNEIHNRAHNTGHSPSVVRPSRYHGLHSSSQFPSSKDLSASTNSFWGYGDLLNYLSRFQRMVKMFGTRIKDLRASARDDPNLSRFQSLMRVYLPRLPKASAEYLVAKVPVVQWSPKYSLSWLWSDLVAGKTLMLPWNILHS